MQNQKGDIEFVFSPPRNPPSCSITDPRWICCSYSKTDSCGVFFYLLGPVAADCAETFVSYAKTIQQTPDNKSTPASNSGMEGGGANTAKIGKTPAQTRQHWCAFRNWTFFWGPTHPRYVNKKRKKGEKAYIYTFVQKRHSEPRHYWCSVYTLTGCRDLRERHEVSWATGGRTFLYKKKVFFSHLHNTLHIREHRKYMDKVLWQESMKLFIKSSSLPSYSVDFVWFAIGS